MPPGEGYADESTRQGDGEDAAADATESTRLRDRAMSAFQRRKQQFQQRREQLSARREQFADALDLSAGSIEPVQLDDRGEEFGFVPDAGGRETLAERFADERPFVDVDDALVEAGPREGVQTRTDPDRTEEIAADARAELATEDPFTEADDLGVEVGPGGVEDARLTDQGRRRRAARELETETPLEDVDPNADVRETDSGLGLDREAQRRSAARGFEDELGTFEQGELDPDSDVREAGDGFGLARSRAREAAADRIDSQVGAVDVAPTDVDLEPTDEGGFEASFEREVQR